MRKHDTVNNIMEKSQEQIHNKIKYHMGEKAYQSAINQLAKTEDMLSNPMIEGHNPETGQDVVYKKNVAENLKKRKQFEKSKLCFGGLGGLLGKD
jgi:hypothetical protein